MMIKCLEIVEIECVKNKDFGCLRVQKTRDCFDRITSSIVMKIEIRTSQGKGFKIKN